MKLVEMKCKNCGALLKVDSEAKDVLCQFCGTVFRIDDEIQHVQYDNMEQSGYEFERGKIKARQDKHKENMANLNKFLLNISLVMLFIVIINFLVFLFNLYTSR